MQCFYLRNVNLGGERMKQSEFVSWTWTSHKEIYLHGTSILSYVYISESVICLLIWQIIHREIIHINILCIRICQNRDQKVRMLEQFYQNLKIPQNVTDLCHEIIRWYFQYQFKLFTVSIKLFLLWFLFP